MNSAALLMGKLPPFRNQKTLIEKKQSVYDIMREVLTAHRIFSNDYDLIAADFWKGDVYNTSEALWKFLKRSVRYKVESEGSQTTKSPSALLAQGVGDCKHYSGFIGGVLDALKRQGKKIDWNYRFASYNSFSRTPEHVFIVVRDKGNEIWIDPVLKSFNEKLRPAHYIDKKVSMLTRISGIGATNNYPASYLLEAVDYNISPRLYNAIQLLLKYGIMNSQAQVNESLILRKYKSNPALVAQLQAAVADTKTAAVGGFFGDVWRGVKKITLAAPRNAYLSLVAINAFGYATKLKHAIYNVDGSYTAAKDKIYTLWNKLGGDWTNLRNTIDRGAKKKAILGVAPAAIPAWVATATAIIAALAPIITAALKAKQQTTPGFNASIDPTTGLPYGSPQISSGGPLDFIKNNPLLVAGGLAAVYFLTKKKNTA